MANGAFKFKDNSGNVVSFISGSGSNISFSGGTLDLSGMTGLTLGNLTLSGTTQNAISASHAASYLLTSSFNTYTGTTNTLIGTLQTSTGSLNSFTSSATTRLNSIEGVSGSYATTGSNQFKNDQVITGSLTVTGFIDAQELRTTYISSSILFRSGSTKFGDELSDTHAFTGSLTVSGNSTFSSVVGINGAIEEGWGLKVYENLKVQNSNGTTVLQVADTATGGKNWSLISSGADNAHSVPVGTFYLRNSTDSLSALAITSGGNVGIGTISPAQKFQINGPLSLSNLAEDFTTNQEYAYPIIYAGNLSGLGNGELVIQPRTTATRSIRFVTRSSGAVSGTNPDTRMIIRWDGNVGIGTVSPSTTLHVANASNAVVRAEGTATNGESTFQLFGKNSSGTARSAVFKYDNADLLRIGITQAVDMRFETNDTERMRITSGGNVGIGTNSPTNSRLLVAGTHVSGNSILGVVPVGNQTATIGLYNSSNVRRGLFYSDTGFVRIESDADPIQILAAGVNGLTVTTDGNVGIGITTPFSRLHVRNSNEVEGAIAIGHLQFPGLIYSSASTGEFRIDNRSSAGSGFITFYPNGQNTTLGSEAMRITTGGNVLIGETNPPVFSTPNGGKLLMLPNAVIVSGLIALGSPYTQNIQIDIVYNNWGGNNVIGLVDMIITLREFANIGGTAFGKVFAVNGGSGATFTSFNTTDVTTSQCTVTATSGGNYTLRITIDPSNVTDRGSFYLVIPNSGGTGSSINSITVSYV